MAVMEGDVPSYALTRAIEVAQKWKNDLEAEPRLGRELFGTVSRYRVVVVGGSGEAWRDPVAATWRGCHNKQSSIEVRSADTLLQSLEQLKLHPESFWRCVKNPVTLPSADLSHYQKSYGYLVGMIKIFQSGAEKYL